MNIFTQMLIQPVQEWATVRKPARDAAKVISQNITAKLTTISAKAKSIVYTAAERLILNSPVSITGFFNPRLRQTALIRARNIMNVHFAASKKTEVIAIQQHIFVSEKHDATPNAQGYTKYTCPVCGYAYVGDITPYASDPATLNAAITEAHYYSKSKFSASEIQSIIDEAESHRELSETNAPQAEYDYAVGEILTAIYSVDELAAYEAVAIKDGEVTIENELGDQKTVSFEEAINIYEAPLDMNGDGIVNAKDYAWLLKNGR
jgi:hypothetical protein